MKKASGLLPGLRYGFVALAMALGLALVASASASEPTGATGNTPGHNSNPGDVQSTTALTCTLNFADVPPTDEFYPYVMCLACQGIIGGYPCGKEPNEPCNANNDPYFRPSQPVTRGQIAKILSISAGFSEPVPPTQETFADVPYGSTFWEYVERLASRGVMDGFACGGDTEPCDWLNRPYFRPSDNTNRGQLMKAVNKALHTGGTSGNSGGSNGVRGGDGPLDGLITRAETAEVVSNAFFPDCAP
jgi:hypothetical protein